MKQIAILAIVTVCGVGVYFKFFAAPSGLNTLLQPADAAASGAPGLWEGVPGSIESQRQPGRHTVVVISATWCGACRQLDGYLKRFVEMRPDIAVRKIDLDQAGGWQEVNQAYGVGVKAVPHVMIYDGDGRLLAADGDGRDGTELLIDWMNAELRNAARD